MRPDRQALASNDDRLRVASPAERSLPALLERQAHARADAVLLRAGEVERSFAEMRDVVAARAGSLVAHGLSPGQRVAIMSDGPVEVLDLCLAAAWTGAVAVPINTALRGDQLGHVIGDSGATVLAIDSDLLPVLEFVDRALPSLDRLWTLGDGDRGGGWRGLPCEPMPEPQAPRPAHPSRPGDVAMILYTSGTTGPSKGVLRPHGQTYWWGLRTARMLGIREGDVLYTCLPLFHTNALNAFVQAVVGGATFHPGPRFSASAFWQRLVESKATVTYLLGPMARILANRAPGPLDRRHRVRIALAPGTPADLHALVGERFGIELINAWGATEANVVLSSAGVEAPPGSMGTVVEGFEAKVVDEEDEEVPADQPGELVVRAREPFSFALGYHDLPQKTVETWRNLWLHTGDRVVRDRDGWFWFMDRITDSIRRRGENISAYEVEQALMSHHEVALAAAVPVPAELGEREVMAFVVPREGAALNPLELVRHCESRIAYFAIPRYVEIVPSLPMTANGKCEKFRLRERGVTETTWDRETEGVTLDRTPLGK